MFENAFKIVKGKCEKLSATPFVKKSEISKSLNLQFFKCGLRSEITSETLSSSLKNS